MSSERAFDMAPQQKLLQKLRGLRLRVDAAISVGKTDYVNVNVNGSFSSWIEVVDGVPRGSVLYLM